MQLDGKCVLGALDYVCAYAYMNERDIQGDNHSMAMNLPQDDFPGTHRSDWYHHKVSIILHFYSLIKVQSLAQFLRNAQIAAHRSVQGGGGRMMQDRRGLLLSAGNKTRNAPRFVTSLCQFV